MEPLFEVSVTYTQRHYLTFYRAWMNSRKAYNWFILLSLLFFAFFLFDAIGKEDGAKIVILSLGIMAIISLRILYPRQLARSLYETNQLERDMETNYRFFPDYYVMENTIGHKTVAYNKLYAVIETKNAFLLMTAKNQGNCIEKSYCSEQIIAFLRRLISPQKRN